ncbi:MAG: CDP-alcohol phosphatidyltransferase family protein [Candidatus Diapherotrites archaeon]|nr:CDP-alcohol phosphatidyltransferase family protein [Candidatus Diapherotrites archaeon]
MIGKILRKKLEKGIFNAIGEIIAKTGISPNTVTFLSLPIAAIGAYFIYLHQIPYALLFVALSVFVDNIDGAVARAQKRVTKWGSYFDAMCDKYVEMIIYIGFAFAGWPLESILAAAGTMINSYAKPCLAIRIPLGNEDWPAIGERAERLLLLIIGMFVSVFMPTIYGYSTISITLILVAILVNIGAIQRMMFAKHLIEVYKKTKKKLMERK